MSWLSGKRMGWLKALNGVLNSAIRGWFARRFDQLNPLLMAPFRWIATLGRTPISHDLIRATQVASADTLWHMVNDLADLDMWHPLVTGTNAPRGQQPKPGLIYRAMTRYLPISTQVFVERVLPGELVSMRLFPLPGLQERVTYRIVSTLCGTCVLYSITLSGWLSPFAWPVMKPQMIKVASALVEAAEMETLGKWEDRKVEIRRSRQKADIFE